MMEHVKFGMCKLIENVLEPIWVIRKQLEIFALQMMELDSYQLGMTKLFSYGTLRLEKSFVVFKTDGHHFVLNSILLMTNKMFF